MGFAELRVCLRRLESGEHLPATPSRFWQVLQARKTCSRLASCFTTNHNSWRAAMNPSHVPGLTKAAACSKGFLAATPSSYSSCLSGGVCSAIHDWNHRPRLSKSARRTLPGENVHNIGQALLMHSPEGAVLILQAATSTRAVQKVRVGLGHGDSGFALRCGLILEV